MITADLENTEEGRETHHTKAIFLVILENFSPGPGFVSYGCIVCLLFLFATRISLGSPV